MRFPAIEPYDHGLLDVGDGNAVYWEVSGRPDGKPALVVHGGPGSGSSPSRRQLFDPARYRIIQLDQRGCGRSLPNASNPATELGANTTRHLIADMEQLRRHLDVDRWLLFGTSWGSTLSLAYAVQHPGRVSEIVLTAVTTGRHSEIDWLYRGVGRFFPEAWERFRDGVPADQRDGDLPAAYARLMNDPDSAVRSRAAQGWCAWEDAVLSTEDQGSPTPYSDRVGAARLAFVRICTHYFGHRLFLPDNLIFERADALAGIPCVMVHGRVDMGGPVVNAWQLNQLLPSSELMIFADAGHLGDATMDEALLAAFARFAPDQLTA